MLSERDLRFVDRLYEIGMAGNVAALMLYLHIMDNWAISGDMWPYVLGGLDAQNLHSLQP
jgi:hypothetical protein